MIDTKEVDRLAKKLKDGRDITQQEALNLSEPFIIARNISSSEIEKLYDSKFNRAYFRWFEEVCKKLPELGNYIFTVPIEYFYTSQKLDKIINKCLSKMHFLDTVYSIECSKNFPITNKNEWDFEGFYKKKFIMAGEIRRLGLFETLSGMERVLKDKMPPHPRSEIFFGLKMMESVYKAPMTIKEFYAHVLMSVVRKIRLPVVFLLFREISNKNFTDFYMSPKDISKIKPILDVPVDGIVSEAIGKGIIRGKYKDQFSSPLVYAHPDAMKEIVERLSDVYRDYCITHMKERAVMEEDSWVEIMK